MCMIREFIVGCVDKHNISRLYRSIVNKTMQEYVVGILNESIIELRKEIVVTKKRVDECTLVDERYFVKCDLYDLKEEIGRFNRICTLMKCISFDDTNV